jgi:hypothetical protein
MAKCRRCGQRKGKRACPASGAAICPACCGAHRVRDIACPPSCRFLAEHKSYQDRRVLERKPGPAAGRGGIPREDDLLKDERLAWLALHIEAPLAETADRNPAFSDGEAILALEFTKDRLTRGRGRLIIPGEDRKAANPVGEAVYLSLENCRYDRAVILVGSGEGYTLEDKGRTLDQVLLAAKAWAGRDFAGRTYLEKLRQQFARIRDMSGPSKIIAPR